MSTPFKFAVQQRLAILCSGEVGDAIARSEHATTEPQYLLRYRAADGRATESWWAQSALEPVDRAEPLPQLPAGDATAAAVAARLGFAPSDYWQPPRIGQVWAGQGGLYAGIARGPDGQPDVHLILCETRPEADGLSWGDALLWVANLDVGGHRDWLLPSRTESALLFANLRDQFDKAWHWTSEQYSRNSAWLQNFGDGGQNTSLKGFGGRARAVRRLVIQPFNPS